MIEISLITLAVVHAALFVMAPVFSVKVLELPFGLHMIAGSLGMAISLGCLDVVNQIWGLKQARRVAISAMVARFIVYIIGTIIVLLPGHAEAGFERIAAESFRVFLAGEATHLLFQVVLDTAIFDWIRRKVNRGFWLRYGLSNIVSMMATSAFFTVLAVSGRGLPLFSVWLGGMAVRLLMMLLLTPIFSGIVFLIQRKETERCESLS